MKYTQIMTFQPCCKQLHGAICAPEWASAACCCSGSKAQQADFQTHCCLCAQHEVKSRGVDLQVEHFRLKLQLMPCLLGRRVIIAAMTMSHAQGHWLKRDLW